MLGLIKLPLIRQPLLDLADGRGRQVGQQLGEVTLRVDVVPTAGAGEGTEDGGGSASSFTTLGSSHSTVYGYAADGRRITERDTAVVNEGPLLTGGSFLYSCSYRRANVFPACRDKSVLMKAVLLQKARH